MGVDKAVIVIGRTCHEDIPRAASTQRAQLRQGHAEVVPADAGPKWVARTLALVAEQASTPEAPWPVRVVSQKISAWIGRLGWVWVDGQVAQISRRPGNTVVFLT
ncbi:MAG TPA: hypothetical protein VFM54_12860, partial [Micromonosporaceae bacterium]|nr:hypothetical protein [Micromonosporaceae bacterium]